jgi:hypothetical protein
VGNTSPCHRIDQGTKTALGNLDLSSFDGVQKRRDVLRTYGSYPQPLLLLKAVPEDTVPIPYQGRLLLSEIRHAGGKPIAANTDAFYELKRWLDNGANRDGVAPVPTHKTGSGACATAVPTTGLTADAAAQVDTTSAAYQAFIQDVQPMLQSSCAFASCHSSPQADLFLTCGDTDQQSRFNYAQAAGFVTLKGTAPEQSEILLRPLAQVAGGVSHTGGTFFQSRDDSTWTKWRDWAAKVQDNPLPPPTNTAGQQFFIDNVMPKLLQRGCALEGCHSPDGFNDYRLRSGAQGYFAPAAIRRNHDTTLAEFMALDTVDVRQSRAVKKTIIAQSGGITHRGAAVLEDIGHTIEEPCPTPFDPMATDNRAFCVFKEWHRIERADRAADLSPMTAGATLPIAFIARPPNPDALLEFDTYRGGADLKLGTATLDANGGVTSVAVTGSGLGACAGLAGQDVDVRGPEWSYDGSKVIFAARPGASKGLDLWELDVGAGTCTRLTTDDGRMMGSVRVHNFDPVFAPDGSVVFASTRAGTLTLKTFLPNADLYRALAPNPDFSNPERMTYLLNSELSPAFMQDGRVSFTAEKATPDFYQLSGRRINWDLSDYHPLLAQRATSTDTFTATEHPSVGYQMATEIREGLDGNFLLILSNVGAKGAGGALATFNRSLGPFEADRTDVTFLHSMVIVDQAATGTDMTAGVYRSPFSLPNGEILASYAANVTNALTDTPKYDLVAVDAQTGQRRALASDPALSYVEAAVGYKRAERELFRNLPELVFGGHDMGAGDGFAIMHFPDVPVLATLLNANLREGRNVAAFDNAVALKVYEEVAPTTVPTSGLSGMQQVFTQRNSLGIATFESDHSLKVRVPAQKPLILELVDGSGNPVFTMREEHQVQPSEYITPGPPRPLFNGICGGCHGSLTGQEPDVAITADALTGASISLSRDLDPKVLQ